MSPSESSSEIPRPPSDGAWEVRSITPFYDSKWIQLAHADVLLPSGEHNPRHHVVKMPAAAMAVLLDSDRTSVLMSWRHRFVSNVWNWELPGGLVDEGEEPAETIARELIEETGYEATSMEHLVSFEPMIGMVTSPHHVYLATDARHVGDPTELNEGRFHWVPLAQVPVLIAKGDIRNSGTLVGLLHYLALSGNAERS